MYEIACCVLEDLAIDFGKDSGALHSAEGIFVGQNWPKRGETVEGFAACELATCTLRVLERACCQIVPDSVAQDIVSGVFNGNVQGVFRGDYGQLSLQR